MQKLQIKNLSQIYAVLVCLVLIFAILLSTVFAVSNITGLLLPELEVWEPKIAFESPNNFRLYLLKKAENNAEQITSINAMSVAELDERRLYEKRTLLASAQRKNFSGLLTALQWLVVSGIFFVVHWWLYRRFSRE
jgi:hypothetical protein